MLKTSCLWTQLALPVMGDAAKSSFTNHLEGNVLSLENTILKWQDSDQMKVSQTMSIKRDSRDRENNYFPQFFLLINKKTLAWLTESSWRDEKGSLVGLQ